MAILSERSYNYSTKFPSVWLRNVLFFNGVSKTLRTMFMYIPEKCEDCRLSEARATITRVKNKIRRLETRSGERHILRILL